MTEAFVPNITVFYCINSFAETSAVAHHLPTDARLKYVKLPCSSMVKDVFILRAFEADADFVIILVCPEGQCRFVEGNIRAKKRTAWVRNLLDEIGLDKRRLCLFNVKTGDDEAIREILAGALSALEDLGPSPARNTQ